MQTIARRTAGATSMARKPPAPEALSKMYRPADDYERIELFRRYATFAAAKFVDDPEAGRREAAAAALHLVLHLDHRAMAPFLSLLEAHRPRQRKSPPARWIPEARIAAATDGLMQIDYGMTEALAAKEVLNTSWLFLLIFMTT
jgi:hypothetical protein